MTFLPRRLVVIDVGDDEAAGGRPTVEMTVSFFTPESRIAGIKLQDYRKDQILTT